MALHRCELQATSALPRLGPCEHPCNMQHEMADSMLTFQEPACALPVLAALPTEQTNVQLTPV